MPAHPLPVGDKAVDWGARDAQQRDVAMAQMEGRAVELVGEIGAARTGSERVVGPIHHVVREQLRAAVEQLAERLLAGFGVEDVLFLDRNPRQRASRRNRALLELGLL